MKAYVTRLTGGLLLAIAAGLVGGCDRASSKGGADDAPSVANVSESISTASRNDDETISADSLDGIESGIEGVGLNVLLVSVDTLRADHVGCYGHETIKTPNMDRFAAEGTRFAKCISSAPLTLPSHTSMLTGSYPFVHGARDNGIFFVNESNILLAELFKERGYATHAEVAAVVLARKYGMDQGFDTYGDVQPRRPTLNMHDVSGLDDNGGPDIELASPKVETDRKAGEITDRGIELLTERAADGRPFFMFLHYFDPHWPHEAPEPFASQYGYGYLGEIAFFDAQFGRLLATVDELGLAEKTLVILVSDHGEGCGEHGEYTHSTFLYDSTLHVPLIIRCPGRIPAGRVVETQVRIIDIATTIVDFTGLDRTDQMQGTSLLPLMADADIKVYLPCYSETLVPNTSLNYSALRSLRTNDWKYILAPRSELYDLVEDDGEIFNIAAIETGRSADMRQEMWDLIADSPSPPGGRGAFREPDAEEVRKLAALGYVSGASMDDFALQSDDELDHFEPVGVNPRDRIEVIEAWSSGLGAYRAGKYEQAVSRYERFMELEPDNPFGPSYMGRALTQLDRFDEAIVMFQRSLELRPDNYIDQRMLGTVLMFRNREAEGVAAFRAALEYNPQDVPSLLNLGIILAHNNEPQEALALFDEGLRVTPEGGTLRLQRGMVLLELDRKAEAIVDLVKAIEIDPRKAKSYKFLAVARFRMGRADEALAGLTEVLQTMPEEAILYQQRARIYAATERLELAGEDFAKVIDLVPDNAMAVQNRGANLLSQQRYTEAIQWLSKAVELRTDFPRALANLAVAQELAGRLEQSSATYEKLLAISTRNPIHYARAANLLTRRGDPAGAIDVLRRGYAIIPDNIMIANDLAWRLATAPDGLADGPLAVSLAKYVNDLKGGESCSELDTLAAAYAAVGRFDDAVETAERALAIARQTAQHDLAGEIAQRLDLFRQGKPYRLQ